MCSPGKVFSDGVDVSGTHTNRSSSSRAANHPMGPKPENLRRATQPPITSKNEPACTTLIVIWLEMQSAKAWHKMLRTSVFMSFLQKSVETNRTEPNELVVDRALRAQYAHTTLHERTPVLDSGEVRK